MVDVVLKGVYPKTESQPYKHYKVIGKFKAGVTLRTGGGIFITVSSKALSKKLEEVFNDEKNNV